MKAFKKADVIEFFNTYISPDAKQRKRLAIYVYPQEMDGEMSRDKIEERGGGSLIENIAKWKSNHGFYGLAEPIKHQLSSE